MNLETGLIEKVWKGFRAPQVEFFGNGMIALLSGKRGLL